MVRRNRRAAALAAVLLAFLGAPAASAPVSFAQSAGDDQYEDPFGGQDQEPAQEEQPAPTPEPAPAEPAPAPAPTDPAPVEPAAESTPAPVEPGAQPAELPRTGLDAGPVLAIGAVLLAGGLALRFRVRERA
jgi:hypothetical protein